MHVVGRPQDGAGGAVVLFELDDAQLWVVLRQAPQVVQRGAAPAVDGLVVIAHGGEVPPRADQAFEQLVLGGVGVLVLVDQHMAQALLPLGPHIGVRAQELEGQADQVVKVHTLVGAQALLVAGHEPCQLTLPFALGLGQRLLGVEALVFPQAQGPLPLAGGGVVGGAPTVFEQAQHVVAVEDGKLRLEAQRLSVFAQQAHAQGVEGADEHLARRFANEGAGALAHFAGGFVGEGDGGDAATGQALANQVANLVRDDPRFARARTGEHQAGAIGVVHGLQLGPVQAGGRGSGHGAQGQSAPS